AAETIRLAAAAGLVGGSIEDASGNPRAPIYAMGQAVQRGAAAAEAAHRLPFPFMLTARAENFLHDKPDLDDTVSRLQAFERAGADVLFAPGLPDLAAVRIVCSALTKPVNFMVGMRGRSFALADLAAAGVRRVSLSTSLYRAAITCLLAAGRGGGGRETSRDLQLRRDHHERGRTGQVPATAGGSARRRIRARWVSSRSWGVLPVNIGQKRGQQPDQRQESAHLVDEVDAAVVRELAEHRRADAAHAERQSEEQSRDH